MKNGNAKHFARRALALCLVLGAALGCAGCGGASAATMFLRKTEGTVQVSDAEGQRVEPAENLGLYSGYAVGTQGQSYAWIDLDKVKLAKLDENSAADIVKEGNALSIEMRSGSLFFNVTEPLAEDETMEICTSSMMVGIRGTCGWVEAPDAQHLNVYILEGRVECTAGGNSAAVNAGEMAEMTADGAIAVKTFAASAVPAFVSAEIEPGSDLAQAILGASGLDLSAWSMTPYADRLNGIENLLYSELIDFEGDGSPELLTLNLRENVVDCDIWRYDGEKAVQAGYTQSLSASGEALSLVESGGMLYIHAHTLNAPTDQNGVVHQHVRDDFFGFAAPGGEWGFVEGVVMADGNRPLFSFGGTMGYADCERSLYESTLNKYTPVREIASYDSVRNL